MLKLNQDYVAAVERILDESPYFALLGMRLTRFEPGLAVFEMTTQTKHLHHFGAAHGGCLGSLLDSATYWAVFGELDPNLSLTTAELKVKFLAPAPPGLALKVTGKTVHLGRSLALAQARAEDAKDGRLIAFGTATLKVLPSKPLGQLAQLSPKFVD
ncbi:MAG: PaaI family thioesterase [Deltaproteobacteria bacterium]|nr:PaaI family thioesterase [Deltaproteobacteria bacterium]